MISQFSSCKLLAVSRDLNRGRDVRIYHIPGCFTEVGIADGTDSWIAPAAASCFDAPIQKLLDEIRLTGKLPVAPYVARKAAVPEPPRRERKRAIIGLPAIVAEALPDRPRKVAVAAGDPFNQPFRKARRRAVPA